MLLTELLPDNADPDSVFDAFSSWTIERGLTLYPAQEEAVMELVSGANVILATPTGSGKSMVAIEEPRLPSPEAVAERKAAWKERFVKLAAYLASR